MFAFLGCFAAAATFNVRDFGAIGDGLTLDTSSIQSAIDRASSQSQTTVSRVFFPPGMYLTGALFLKSFVFLELDNQATLLGSSDYHDYPDLRQGGVWALIQGISIHDAGIVGGGEINGRAASFYGEYDAKDQRIVPITWSGIQECTGECRPRLGYFRESSNLTFSGVTLRDSPDWTLWLLGCKNVTINALTIRGDKRWPNNDGIDLDHSSNISITNSHIEVGDDGICLKSDGCCPELGPTSDIVVRDCTISTKSSAIKIGSSTVGEFANILFDRISIVDSARGLGIQVRDQGSVRNVTYQNINLQTRFVPGGWWGRGEAIWITNVRRGLLTKPGSIANVSFINITGTAENSVFITGKNGGVLENITFQRLRLTIDKWSNYSTAQGVVQHDYRPTSVVIPDVVSSPVDAVYIEFARQISFSDSVIVWGANPQSFWSFTCLNLSQTSAIDGSGLKCK